MVYSLHIAPLIFTTCYIAGYMAWYIAHLEPASINCYIAWYIAYLLYSIPAMKQTRSTVSLSAVVTTLADSQRRMQTSGRSRDSRAGIFFSELELGPRPGSGSL